MQQHNQLIRIFNKPNEHKGNLVMVIAKDEPTSSLADISAQLEKENGIATTCFFSALKSADNEASNNFKVQCFNGHSAIQCCGHGMIAAAKSIFDSTGLSQININQSIKATQDKDANAKNNISLSLPRLASQQVEIPNWTKQLLHYQAQNITPSDVAQSEKSDGYLLLELAATITLKQFSAMTIDEELICKQTQRAVVVILFDKNKDHLYLRYFAPQYGVTEDSATGSVMRFVADFIAKKYHSKQYEVTQCSQSGGYMHLTCHDSNVVITSHVKVEPYNE